MLCGLECPIAKPYTLAGHTNETLASSGIHSGIVPLPPHCCLSLNTPLLCFHTELCCCCLLTMSAPAWEWLRTHSKGALSTS